MKFFMNVMFLVAVFSSIGLMGIKYDSYRDILKDLNTIPLISFKKNLKDWDINNFVQLAHWLEKEENAQELPKFFESYDPDSKDIEEYHQKREFFLDRFKNLYDSFLERSFKGLKTEDKERVIRIILPLLLLQNDKKNLRAALFWLEQYPSLLFLQCRYYANAVVLGFNGQVIEYLVNMYNTKKDVVMTLSDLKEIVGIFNKLVDNEENKKKFLKLIEANDSFGEKKYKKEIRDLFSEEEEKKEHDKELEVALEEGLVTLETIEEKENKRKELEEQKKLETLEFAKKLEEAEKKKILEEEKMKENFDELLKQQQKEEQAQAEKEAEKILHDFAMCLQSIVSHL